MALVPCPDCEREVSDQALACPQCGLPVKERLQQLREEEEERQRLANEEAQRRQEQREAAWAWVIGIAIAAIFIIAVIATHH